MQGIPVLISLQERSSYHTTGSFVIILQFPSSYSKNFCLTLLPQVPSVYYFLLLSNFGRIRLTESFIICLGEPLRDGERGRHSQQGPGDAAGREAAQVRTVARQNISKLG